MKIQRIKQFAWGIQSSFKKIDDNYVDKFLNKAERNLFNKLNKNEKCHSIRVSKDVIKIANEKNISIDKHKLAKIGLLHDVGKSYFSLNLIEKSAIVLLNKVTKGKIKKYSNVKQIDIYYNHAEKGVKLLSSLKKYDDDFIETIKLHHQNVKSTNIFLNLIKESDELN